MTVARGAALAALAIAIVAVALLVFGGGRDDDVQAAPGDGGAAGQGRRRPDRRAPRRLDPRDQAHRQQRGRDHLPAQEGVRAPAPGHDRDRARDLAVGHRQPLHRADARPAEQPEDPRRRADPLRQDDVPGLAGPALQHARPQDAQEPPGGHPGLRDVVPAARAPRPTAVPSTSTRRSRPPTRLVNQLTQDQQSFTDFVVELVAPRHRARLSQRDDLTDLVSNTDRDDAARSPTRTPRSTRRSSLLPGTLRRGQHHLREPARDARRPRHAGLRVQARDQGPRASSSASCARSCTTRARRSTTSRR